MNKGLREREGDLKKGVKSEHQIFANRNLMVKAYRINTKRKLCIPTLDLQINDLAKALHTLT